MKFRLLILKGLGLSLALASAGAFAANEATPAPPAGFEKAIFAGGCFWCVEHEFEGVSGIQSVVSGYVGGKNAMPTYKQVSAGGTGHAEAVEVVFDPKRISYGELLKIFWRNIDPYAQNRQFCDSGDQYRSAVFYVDETQRAAAAAFKASLVANGKLKGTVYTELNPAGPFYLAEDYHQDYAQKNSVRYKYYRYSCGRDARLKEIWGAPAEKAK